MNKHKKLKTICSEILYKFCLKQDGMGNFVIFFGIQLLNYIFQVENMNTLADFPLLNQPYAERVGKYISQENKIAYY